jgi:NarL family two-component system sensor histidine kinase LiaS
VLEERRRLARDVHDSVKQHVFSIALLVSSSRSLLARDPARADACLAEIDGLVRHVQGELTSLVHQLRPAGLGERGLACGLEELAAAWRQRTPMAIRLRLAYPASCPEPVEEALFLVAGEALANAVRHSLATCAGVELNSGDGALCLAVTDDGPGFDPAAVSRGIGLASMRERMEAVGGDA